MYQRDSAVSQRLFTLICMLMGVLFVHTQELSAEVLAWKLEKEADGISIYTASVEGSDFKAFRAVMEVTASLNQMVSMHTDPDNISEWLYDCKKSELIKKVKDNEFYIYYVSDAPWPVQDRDYVLHSVITQDPDTYVAMINFKSETSITKNSEECVRMAEVTGYWQFKPLKAGKVRIEYQVHADPNGALPSWLANAAVVEQPFETMKTIRQHMINEKYVNAQLSFIREPNR